jgi:hypothetical protein
MGLNRLRNLVKVVARQSIPIGSEAVQTATVSNTIVRQTFYEITIPANKLKFGDLVRVHFMGEVVALTSGEVRYRIRLNTDDELVTGYFPKTSIGRSGFVFNQFAPVDTGSGLSAARLVGDGIDVVVDLTVDNIINFTAEATVADADNQHRGLYASLRIV